MKENVGYFTFFEVITILEYYNFLYYSNFIIKVGKIVGKYVGVIYKIVYIKGRNLLKNQQQF